MKSVKLKPIILFSLWFIAVMACLVRLNWYKSIPGEVGEYRASWPHELPISNDSSKSTLVVFVHPKCECSDATLSELADMQREHAFSFTTMVFFYHPEGTSGDWAHTDLWDKAKKMPNTMVFEDPAGAVARLFGARTSGQTYLYGQDSRLKFAGGMTDTRGHVGYSAGRRSIASIMKGTIERAEFGKAFGCGLFSHVESMKYGLSNKHPEKLERNAE